MLGTKLGKILLTILISPLAPALLSTNTGKSKSPTGISNEVSEKLSKAIGEIVKRPEVNQRLINLGIDPSFATSARYEKILSTEIPKWGQVIKIANIRID